jgi:hydroxymethylglutaryl-CoA lyase
MDITSFRGRRITVVEVGPRDGLQNEHASISTADKISFVDRLSAADLPVI